MVVPGDQSTPKDLLPGGATNSKAGTTGVHGRMRAHLDAAADREKKEYPVLSCLRPERYLHDAHEYEAGAHDAASIHYSTFELSFLFQFTWM